MLDIRMIRENPDIVRANLRKRGSEEKLKLLEKLIKDDALWRKLLSETNELRKQKNIITIKVASLKKEGKKADKELKEANSLDKKISDNEEKVKQLEEGTRNSLMRIPNIIHDSVPIGKDDSENVELRRWGKIPEFGFKIRDHIELGLMNDFFDIERAAKVSGARFYYLKNDLVELDLALQQFGLAELKERGFKIVEPPFMIRRKPYEGVTDLGDFEDVMYKVEGEDLYLIATSEHPLVSMFMDEIIEEEKLPIKLAGISPCFRKEAGSHGRDTKGIFRVHQFNKVEQVIFCRPEDSWKMHEDLIKNTEHIFQKLELPYKIVDICTGDIGTIAAKKYDLEVWLPGQNNFREAASCSNCTDYQARRLNIRMRRKAGDKPEILHTLNNTGIATGRAMIAIMENYQQEDGSIVIPKALRKHMDGREVIPARK
ncbi:serine--tRNA ligase [Candidatus Micrarchaeota archaeon RBG_16_49_10]|nr:MAG: serine--tRNA ligase [Candidatus Micrarchaeota archaeon RBG_16_49_10]